MRRESQLEMIDTVVFDVDGVLVDTDSSYTEAVLLTVQWLLVHDAGIADDGPVVSRADIRAFKIAGGWNNDWDLSTAMYRWLLAGVRSRPAATTTMLRQAAGSAAEAAGLSLEEHGSRARTHAPRSWEEIRGIFDEFYAGTAVAVARHGMRPRVHAARGLVETERVLLRRALIDELRALGVSRFGVVTGRGRAEWEAIADRVPLPPGTVVSTAEHGQKPDPAPLRRVVDALGSRSALTVGDTMDDLHLVVNYTRLAGAVPCVPVVLCLPEDESVYRAAGGSVFVRSIDDLPGAVRALA